MRIIGGKDYYDGALAFGRDESLVFARERLSKATLVAAKNLPLETPNRLLTANKSGRWIDPEAIKHKDACYAVVPASIWFAGKRYGAVFAYNRFWNSKGTDRTWFWNAAELKDFLSQVEVTLSPPERWSNDWIDASKIEDHFNDEGRVSDREWLIANGIAIAIPDTDIYGEKGWFFNTDGLKKMDFARVLHPYAALQELSMYVGGVMVRPENPSVTITDDKVIASKHGFDDWSFRKMPAPR